MRLIQSTFLVSLVCLILGLSLFGCDEKSKRDTDTIFHKDCGWPQQPACL